MDAINWHSVFFLIVATLTCGLALAVVVSSNVVRMAFYLVLTLVAVAGLFFLAGAEFVGAMQVLVYVGGTMVLLAFGVMLTARGPLVSMQTDGGQWVVATLVGCALLVVLLKTTVLSIGTWSAAAETKIGTVPESTATQLGLGLMGVRTDKLAETNPSRREGLAGYLLPFEIISVHLVVVLVGAAYLARARRRRRAAEDIAEEGPEVLRPVGSRTR